jgi:uncharacterized membrane protein YcaP (DUF421 family)
VDDTEIIATFVIIDDVLHRLGYRAHCLAQTAAAEVLLVAVLATRYFQNHHERARYFSRGHASSVVGEGHIEFTELRSAAYGAAAGGPVHTDCAF